MGFGGAEAGNILCLLAARDSLCREGTWDMCKQADIIYDIYVVMGTVPLPFCVLAVSTSTVVSTPMPMDTISLSLAQVSQVGTAHMT